MFNFHTIFVTWLYIRVHSFPGIKKNKNQHLWFQVFRVSYVHRYALCHSASSGYHIIGMANFSGTYLQQLIASHYCLISNEDTIQTMGHFNCPIFKMLSLVQLECAFHWS